MSARFYVYAADRSGNSWTVGSFERASAAVIVAKRTRAANPRWAVGVSDDERDGRSIDEDDVDPEVMPVADALADAEALRVALDAHDTYAVMWNALSAYDFMRNPHPSAVSLASTYARWAARAAFGIVPSLRGDQ